MELSVERIVRLGAVGLGAVPGVGHAIPREARNEREHDIRLPNPLIVFDGGRWKAME